jgi:hypothetical protein
MLFGYDFEETWGVSQITVEAFALGTLACILGLGIVGYIRGSKVRLHKPDEGRRPHMPWRAVGRSCSS